MKEIKDNDVYLALDNKKSDEFILKQNLDALRNTKNAEMTRITQDLVSIPATLVRLKWHNRREIYPLQVKEEIYGAVMNTLIEQRPELKEKLLGRLEANYQYLLAREVATLRLTRKLSDGEYRTSNVTCVALDEDALASQAPAPTETKTDRPTRIKKPLSPASLLFRGRFLFADQPNLEITRLMQRVHYLHHGFVIDVLSARKKTVVSFLPPVS